MPASEQVTSLDSPDVVAVQRRTVRVLVGSQVLGGVGVASGIAVGGLLAEKVSGSTTLSGFASTATVLGAALTAVPLARLSGQHGRRYGLSLGWALGALGAVLVVVGAVAELFAILLAGMVLFGAASAANLQSRYAATDLAPAHRRGRALSVVVWATTVGAVLGPNLSGAGADVGRALDLPPLAGPFLFSIVAFTGGALVVGLLLRPDPLQVARAHAPGGDVPGARKPPTRIAHSVRVVASSPRAVLGLTTVALGHALMVAVMAMTPVHMDHHGASLSVVGLVISGHIAGMYALSPVMGVLVDKVGRLQVVLLGQVLLLTAVAVSGHGSHMTWALGVGLVLLGLGWSCTVVAGSTLLADGVPVPERPAAQGLADLVMNGAAAIAGAASGAVLGWVGYGGLNALAALLVVPVLVLAARRRT